MQATWSECAELRRATVNDATTSAEPFAALVSTHAPMVLRIARAVLRDAQEAEDAAQECFIRALRHEREVLAADDPQAWLATTVWRISVNLRRHAPTLSLDDEGHVYEALAAQPAEAERLLIEDEQLTLLRAMIAALPDELREPLELATVVELSGKQIAEILKLPEATVRTRQHRARLALKEQLQKHLAAADREARRRKAEHA